MVFRRTPREIILLALFCGAAVCFAACSATPTPTPTALSSPTPLSQAEDDSFCPPPPNWYRYVTQSGDSLRSLAERTSSTISALEAANCLNNPRALASGQVIYLPRRPITP